MNPDNFIKDAKFKDNVFSATIPTHKLDLILGTQQLLKDSQGRQRDTQYNKIDISNLRGCYINTGYRIEGDWKFQHRELILNNPILNKKHYTPWSEDTGTFYQEISIRVSNGIAIVNNGKVEVKRRHQGIIRDLIGDFLVYGENNFRDKFVEKLKNKVQSLNGQSIADKLIENGVQTLIASQIPLINESQVIGFIKFASTNIDGEFNPTGLRIYFRFDLLKYLAWISGLQC